jgi:8-oxo-dGTP diphosphatase
MSDNAPSQPAPVIDVAVGIMIRPDGKALMAERPQDKPSGGYWEFPGGKFEPGESPVEALVRELHEELGVEVETAWPWITRQHVYPYATVRLHIYRILHWRGEPHGREGQHLAWVNPDAPDVAPLLSANHGIMQALALPQVYAITHASYHGIADFMPRLEAALANGVRLVQIRERDMPASTLETFARDATARAHAVGARVIINSDERLCRTVGADGVHLPAGQLMQLDARPQTGLCAASCHNRDELLRAVALGVDFAVLSPVLPTLSHPGAPTLGWERFAQLCADLPMPVYALGGMQVAMLDTAMSRNAHGVALLSGIW